MDVHPNAQELEMAILNGVPAQFETLITTLDAFAHDIQSIAL